MNKILKIFLAIIGGVDVIVTILIPIFIGALWINVAGLIDWKVYFFFTLGLISALFRAIKVGFMKQKIGLLKNE